MINKIAMAVFGLAMIGAMVLFSMAWGRFVAPSTSIDTNGVMMAGVLGGAILIYPISGLLRARRR